MEEQIDTAGQKAGISYIHHVFVRVPLIPDSSRTSYLKSRVIL